VALVAIVIAVGGIFLLRGLTPAPIEQPVVTNFEECRDVRYPILESYPRQCQTPDGRVFMEEIAEADKNSCNTTGCSGQVCSNQEVITTCEFLPEYVCYRNAVCERQSNGECGWTQTNELTQCLEEQSAKQDQIDTSDWQTYRNEEFGFEVKYPSLYSGIDKKIGYVECMPQVWEETAQRISFGPIRLDIKDPQGLTLSEYIDQIIQKYKETEKRENRMYDLKPKTDTTLGGEKAMEVIVQWCGVGCNESHTIYVPKGNKMWEFSYDNGVLNPCPLREYESPDETADQILSTFRFINPE